MRVEIDQGRRDRIKQWLEYLAHPKNDAVLSQYLEEFLNAFKQIHVSGTCLFLLLQLIEEPQHYTAHLQSPSMQRRGMILRLIEEIARSTSVLEEYRKTLRIANFKKRTGRWVLNNVLEVGARSQWRSRIAQAISASWDSSIEFLAMESRKTEGKGCLYVAQDSAAHSHLKYLHSIMISAWTLKLTEMTPQRLWDVMNLPISTEYGHGAPDISDTKEQDASAGSMVSVDAFANESQGETKDPVRKPRRKHSLREYLRAVTCNQVPSDHFFGVVSSSSLRLCALLLISRFVFQFTQQDAVELFLEFIGGHAIEGRQCCVDHSQPQNAAVGVWIGGQWWPQVRKRCQWFDTVNPQRLERSIEMCLCVQCAVARRTNNSPSAPSDNITAVCATEGPCCRPPIYVIPLLLVFLRQLLRKDEEEYKRWHQLGVSIDSSVIKEITFGAHPDLRTAEFAVAALVIMRWATSACVTHLAKFHKDVVDHDTLNALVSPAFMGLVHRSGLGDHPSGVKRRKVDTTPAAMMPVPPPPPPPPPAAQTYISASNITRTGQGVFKTLEQTAQAGGKPEKTPVTTPMQQGVVGKAVPALDLGSHGGGSLQGNEVQSMHSVPTKATRGRRKVKFTALQSIGAFHAFLDQFDRPGRYLELWHNGVTLGSNDELKECGGAHLASVASLLLKTLLRREKEGGLTMMARIASQHPILVHELAASLGAVVLFVCYSQTDAYPAVHHRIRMKGGGVRSHLLKKRSKRDEKEPLRLMQQSSEALMRVPENLRRHSSALTVRSELIQRQQNWSELWDGFMAPLLSEMRLPTSVLLTQEELLRRRSETPLEAGSVWEGMEFLRDSAMSRKSQQSGDLDARYADYYYKKDNGLVLPYLWGLPPVKNVQLPGAVLLECMCAVLGRVTDDWVSDRKNDDLDPIRAGVNNTLLAHRLARLVNPPNPFPGPVARCRLLAWRVVLPVFHRWDQRAAMENAELPLPVEIPWLQSCLRVVCRLVGNSPHLQWRLLRMRWSWALNRPLEDALNDEHDDSSSSSSSSDDFKSGPSTQPRFAIVALLRGVRGVLRIILRHTKGTSASTDIVRLVQCICLSLADLCRHNWALRRLVARYVLEIPIDISRALPERHISLAPTFAGEEVSRDVQKTSVFPLLNAFPPVEVRGSVKDQICVFILEWCRRYMVKYQSEAEAVLLLFEAILNPLSYTPRAQQQSSGKFGRGGQLRLDGSYELHADSDNVLLSAFVDHLPSSSSRHNGLTAWLLQILQRDLDGKITLRARARFFVVCCYRHMFTGQSQQEIAEAEEELMPHLKHLSMLPCAMTGIPTQSSVPSVGSKRGSSVIQR